MWTFKHGGEQIAVWLMVEFVKYHLKKGSKHIFSQIGGGLSTMRSNAYKKSPYTPENEHFETQMVVDKMVYYGGIHKTNNKIKTNPRTMNILNTTWWWKMMV